MRPLIFRMFALVALSGAGVLDAQSPASTQRRPIPYPVVPPAGFLDAVREGTRTLTGEPGPNYWQQWTDYQLRARLLPDEKRVVGSARILYHNRSPDQLQFLALQLAQNVHTEGAVRHEPMEVTKGIELDEVTVGGRPAPEMARPGPGPGYMVFGTTLGVFLDAPLAPRDSVSIAIRWAFDVPQAGASGRMGWSEDNLFHIAYWYPHMAVYDDIVSFAPIAGLTQWQIDQFTGGSEFYAGFGSYDLTIEAPPGWVVMATGALENPDAVLSDPVLERYRHAHQSDTVVHVMTAADFGSGKATKPAPGGYLSWRFTSDSVRDVAFSAVRASNWDAARTSVGDRNADGATDYALINAFWRASSPHWSSVWRYAQHSITLLSEYTGFPYPWPHMTVVEGSGIIGGGMEFPMVTLIGGYAGAGQAALHGVTAHELAHMWVPMIVSNDERRYAWMDEGTTSFSTTQAQNAFYERENHEAEDMESYLQIARVGLEGEIMRRSDFHYDGAAYGTASYPKPAVLLGALREMLGRETFQEAFQTFIRNWAYKHPQPWDLFNTFNTVSGQNLDWFWRTWYYETWTLDHAVGSVTVTGGTTTITIEDRGWAPMPARVSITLEDGQVLVREVPVETWLGGATTATIDVDGNTPVTRVEIDASAAFPDIDRENNVWERGQ